MSELLANCSIPHTNAEYGDRDAPQVEVGGGPPEQARARPEEPGEGLMAAAREVPVAAAGAAGMAEVTQLVAEPAEEEGQEGWPRNGPGLAALPHLIYREMSVWEMTFQRLVRHFQQLYVRAVVRMQGPERHGRFLEEEFDAEHPQNHQRMDFDILTGLITLAASEVINPLVEELGCDKLISRE
ncbi:EP300-interacting inhibitor of differentiation 2-like [Manis pentadactyla]|uniref:EP300-interacting inhibitor of differentiation 2-like n=1 Tax=Manis pentadactyla TaxID=143292 RepID=UPI00255D0251|nr:EP300-interacting inhibitor of differentiation 2-like [Manis pentadactyla]